MFTANLLVAAILEIGTLVSPLGDEQRRSPEPVTVEQNVQPVAEPASEPNTVEEVVVQGRRNAISRFVREQAAKTGRNRLARWSGAVCPGVVGLPEKYGGVLAERISQEARAVGLDVGAPGCKPDLLVLVTNDANKAARDYRALRPEYFGKYQPRGSSESGGGGQSLESFLNTTNPVRWWHVSSLKAADGRPLQWVNFDPQGLPGGVLVPLITGQSSSRLASQVREDIVRAVIIVETTQVRGVTYEALGSYLAMVGLAQLDPDADPGSLPTILNLFRDRTAGLDGPDTLTDIDRAYLRGLYDAQTTPATFNRNAAPSAAASSRSVAADQVLDARAPLG